MPAVIDLCSSEEDDSPPAKPVDRKRKRDEDGQDATLKLARRLATEEEIQAARQRQKRNREEEGRGPIDFRRTIELDGTAKGEKLGRR